MRGSRVRDVVSALKGAFEAKGWHGPTVLEAIQGVTAAQARRKPAGAHHSIHELVDHIAYCERAALHYLKHGRPPANPGDEWAAPRASFAVSVRRLKAAHRALVEAVRGLRDADLDRVVQTQMAGRMSLGKVLHGVAAHDTYHGGQIRLLRTLL